MNPTSPYIKRAALELWLVGVEGFTGHTVKDLLSAGTIPRTTFPGRKHAYYHVPAVATALRIANPLSNQPNPTTTQPC